MKGSYYFKVKSKRALFEFRIRRNITVIKGESATGKTTLLHMLYEYLRTGRESGYSVSTDAEYYVYLRREVGRDWRDALLPLRNTIIFIEENNEFVFSKEFADFVKTSGNYFVLVNRAPFKMLPYSIHEIYEIITDGKRTDIKESYHELRELYSNYPVAQNNHRNTVITEDSNSGYQFFSQVFAKSRVVSANGNGNILNLLRNQIIDDTLVIADGAAFGAMIENCLGVLDSQSEHRITMWLPESFEYLILASGILPSRQVDEILEHTSDYVDCAEYESWERFFTDLLVELTENQPSCYVKERLNPYYLQERIAEKIMRQYPMEQ